jgi:NADPH:quinone reductase-like Zn-dependent oxidoreductase
MECPKGSKFKVGDEVVGLLGYDSGGCGGAADYAVAEEEELAYKPRNVSATESAAVPLGGLMAWQVLEGAGLRSSLIDEAETEGEVEGKEEGGEKGELIRVLIIGATSEVGRYVVQLLRSNAAPFDGGIRRRRERKRGKCRHEDRKGIFWICATCSSREDESYLRADVGVDEVVVLDNDGDHSSELSQTFTDREWPPADVVIDCEDDGTASGHDVAVSLASSPRIIRCNGGWEVLKVNQPEWSVEMVDVLGGSRAEPGENKNKSWSFTVRPNGIQLAEIVDVVENGELKPIVEREFGLYEAQEAMEFVEGAKRGKGVRGKIVLRVNN